MGYGVPAAGVLCLEHLQPIYNDALQAPDDTYPSTLR